MKTISKILMASFAVGVIVSCKDQADETVSEEKAVAETTSNPISKVNVGDRKFVRTADIRFKAKNVAQSTYAIENAATHFGGFVTSSELKSTISQRNQTKVSQDSILETTKYTVENNITIRVQNAKLDTVVKIIAKQIDFLDTRIVKADDVALQMLANQVAQNRGAETGQRMAKAIDSKAKQLDAVLNAESNLVNQKSETDSKKLANLSLEDRVNFSTLALQLYQNETLKHEMIAGNFENHRPHIGLLIVDGLKTGWYLLESIIGFVVQLWSIVLLAVLGFLVYKKYLKGAVLK